MQTHIVLGQLYCIDLQCLSWQWHRSGSCWSPVQTLPVAPSCCDLGFFPNSCGNKAAANLQPTNKIKSSHKLTLAEAPLCKPELNKIMIQGFKKTFNFK